MGYSMFVCRLSGRVSTDANISHCNIYENKNGKLIWYDEKETQPKNLELVEEHKPYEISTEINDPKKRKVQATAEYCENLEVDLDKTFDNNVKYLSCRILLKGGLFGVKDMKTWNKFWGWIDKWTKDRENEKLIKKIKKYLY